MEKFEKTFGGTMNATTGVLRVPVGHGRRPRLWLPTDSTPYRRLESHWLALHGTSCKDESPEAQKFVVVVRPALGESVSPEWGEISLHVWEGLGSQSGGRGTLRYRVLI